MDLIRPAISVASPLSAGEDGDVLKHCLASVAESGSFDGETAEYAFKLIDHESGERFAFDIVGDDDESQTALDDLLEQRKYLLKVADLLVGDEDNGVLDDRFHFVGVGSHIRARITAVELHAFDYGQFGVHGFTFVYGDNAIFADLFHSFGNELADVLVGSGNGCDGSDLAFVLNGLRDGFQRACRGFGSLGDAFTEQHGIRARRYVFKTFADDCLRKYRRGGGSVAGYVVGLDGNFLDELCAHILEGVFEFDLFCDRDAVVGDERRTVFSLEDYVPSFRSEREFDGIRQCVYALFERFASFFAVFELFSHIYASLIYP